MRTMRTQNEEGGKTRPLRGSAMPTTPGAAARSRDVALTAPREVAVRVGLHLLEGPRALVAGAVHQEDRVHLGVLPAVVVHAALCGLAHACCHCPVTPPDRPPKARIVHFWAPLESCPAPPLRSIAICRVVLTGPALSRADAH